jgi:glycosyltransferase involved in cell wall biosynthesis
VSIDGFNRTTGLLNPVLELSSRIMGGDEALVSVVVPTYKRREKLRRAIASIDAQSYGNLEVVVVNGDPETDVTDITASNHPTTHVHHNENYGISKTRNDGIAHAEGEFIAFLDDDDEWKPSKVEQQMAEFVRLGDSYGMVYAGRDVMIREETARTQIPSISGDVYANLLYKNFITSETPIVRATCLSDVGGFDTDLEFAEDYDLWLRIAQKYKIGVVSESLAVAHQGHPDRLSNDWERRYSATERLIEKHCADLRTESRALGRRHRRLGVYALQTDRTKEAMWCFITGLRSDPDLVTLVFLLATPLPDMISKGLLNLRQRIVSFGTRDGIQRWVSDHVRSNKLSKQQE